MSALVKALMFLVEPATLFLLGYISSSGETTHIIIMGTWFICMIIILRKLVFRKAVNSIVDEVQRIYPSRTGARYIIYAVYSVLVGIYTTPALVAEIENSADDIMIVSNVLILVISLLGIIFSLDIAKVGRYRSKEFKEQEFKEKVEEYVRNME